MFPFPAGLAAIKTKKLCLITILGNHSTLSRFVFLNSLYLLREIGEASTLCRLTIHAPEQGFGGVFDSSKRVQDAAGWNIWLLLTAVGLLLAAHWLQLATVTAALLKPILRMFSAVLSHPGNAQLSDEVSKHPLLSAATEPELEQQSRLLFSSMLFAALCNSLIARWRVWG